MGELLALATLRERLSCYLNALASFVANPERRRCNRLACQVSAGKEVACSGYTILRMRFNRASDRRPFIEALALELGFLASSRFVDQSWSAAQTLKLPVAFVTTLFMTLFFPASQLLSREQESLKKRRN
jgi:hypothetical protein